MEKARPRVWQEVHGQCYPTYLVLDAKGKELHRFSSSQTPEEFMKDLVFTDTRYTKYNSQVPGRKNATVSLRSVH